MPCVLEPSVTYQEVFVSQGGGGRLVRKVLCFPSPVVTNTSCSWEPAVTYQEELIPEGGDSQAVRNISWTEASVTPQEAVSSSEEPAVSHQEELTRDDGDDRAARNIWWTEPSVTYQEVFVQGSDSQLVRKVSCFPRPDVTTGSCTWEPAVTYQEELVPEGGDSQAVRNISSTNTSVTPQEAVSSQEPAVSHQEELIRDDCDGRTVRNIWSTEPSVTYHEVFVQGSGGQLVRKVSCFPRPDVTTVSCSWEPAVTYQEELVPEGGDGQAVRNISWTEASVTPKEVISSSEEPAVSNQEELIRDDGDSSFPPPEVKEEQAEATPCAREEACSTTELAVRQPWRPGQGRFRRAVCAWLSGRER